VEQRGALSTRQAPSTGRLDAELLDQQRVGAGGILQSAAVYLRPIRGRPAHVLRATLFVQVPEAPISTTYLEEAEAQVAPPLVRGEVAQEQLLRPLLRRLGGAVLRRWGRGASRSRRPPAPQPPQGEARHACPRLAAHERPRDQDLGGRRIEVVDAGRFASRGWRRGERETARPKIAIECLPGLLDGLRIARIPL